MTTAAVLLAAGESSRMDLPKALLPWGDATLIEYQVRELIAAGIDDIVVVLGHASEEIRPRVPGPARVVVNEAYREGRASSLRAGAAALPDEVDPVVIANVDQPRPRELLRDLLDQHRDAGSAVTVPVGGGRRRHPVVVAGALLPELRNASEEELGLRGVLAAHEDAVLEVHLASPLVLVDINTPEDYERALSAFGLAGRDLPP